MATYLLTRVDGSIDAVESDGDHAAEIRESLDLALAIRGSSIHVALVEASNACEARTFGAASVEYWIGTSDVDADHVSEIARSMAVSLDIEATIALASALADVTGDHDVECDA